MQQPSNPSTRHDPENAMHAPKFNWEFNFGHVMTSLTIAMSIGSGVWYISTHVERQAGQIKALEQAKAQYMPQIESIQLRLSSNDVQVTNLRELVSEQRRTSSEILSTLGVIRENIASMNARIAPPPQSR
jgi:hypothetical protein